MSYTTVSHSNPRILLMHLSAYAPSDLLQANGVVVVVGRASHHLPHSLHPHRQRQHAQQLHVLERVADLLQTGRRDRSVRPWIHVVPCVEGRVRDWLGERGGTVG